MSNKPATSTRMPPIIRRPVAITQAAMIFMARPIHVSVSGVILLLLSMVMNGLVSLRAALLLNSGKVVIYSSRCLLQQIVVVIHHLAGYVLPAIFLSLGPALCSHLLARCAVLEQRYQRISQGLFVLWWH